MSQIKLNVYSEIGKLKTVLLHKPGKEISNLIPSYLQELLFDDVPHLRIAQKEHDFFAKTLQNSGVETLFAQDLLCDVLSISDALRRGFIDELIVALAIDNSYYSHALRDYFISLSAKELSYKMFEGMLYEELELKGSSLSQYAEKATPYLFTPAPNFIFQRDPFSTIGSGVVLCKMKFDARKRESICLHYILKHHPRLMLADNKFWYGPDNYETTIEGGDICVLNKTMLAVGISQRTDARSIEIFAERLFKSDESFDTILAMEFPKTRAFMHLDTVFTQLDYDKFSYFSGFSDNVKVYVLKKCGKCSTGFKVNVEENTLQNILEKYLDRKVTLIPCAGDDPIQKHVEQWNDGSNTLSIAPGEVVVYERNEITNRKLQEHGVKIHLVPSSELSRARGGPRCMSMPLVRDAI